MICIYIYFLIYTYTHYIYKLGVNHDMKKDEHDISKWKAKPLILSDVGKALCFSPLRWSHLHYECLNRVSISCQVMCVGFCIETVLPAISALFIEYFGGVKCIVRLGDVECATWAHRSHMGFEPETST